MSTSGSTRLLFCFVSVCVLSAISLRDFTSLFFFCLSACGCVFCGPSLASSSLAPLLAWRPTAEEEERTRAIDANVCGAWEALASPASPSRFFFSLSASLPLSFFESRVVRRAHPRPRIGGVPLKERQLLQGPRSGEVEVVVVEASRAGEERFGRELRDRPRHWLSHQNTKECIRRNGSRRKRKKKRVGSSPRSATVGRRWNGRELNVFSSPHTEHENGR